MTFFLHWLVAAIAIAIAAYLIPSVSVTVVGALVLAVVLGVINVFIRPFITLLTLPITILTLGLFSLVINALLVWFAGWIVPGVVIPGFWSALIFSIVLAIINTFFGVRFMKP
jgi:putative membrane protein